MSGSSHFDESGNARMVDVSAKSITHRRAVAVGHLSMKPETAAMIRDRAAKKGDVLAVATLAAIQATKLTHLLIPLCHAIPVESVDVHFQWDPADRDDARLECHVTVATSSKTGVEMEAMTAAAVACLTVYDMVKSVDRDVTVGPIRLSEKAGGKSGHYRRDA